MDRLDYGGLGVAVVGHVAVVAALTVGLMQVGAPVPTPDPIEISYVEDVALTSTSPAPSSAPAAASVAPTPGPVEEAAPAASLPARRQELMTVRPAPAAPAAQPQRDARDRRRPEEGRGSARESRGSLLGPDFLKGLGRDPASRAQAAPAAAMSAQAAADIAQAIARQVQPCADRQVYPGPGAERIVTSIQLRLNRDGSLAARPRVGRQRGIDDENRRYAERVADLAIRSFVECAPLRGLPAELYDVPRGWSNFTMNYRMPG